MNAYTPRAIPPTALAELRMRDDSGRVPVPYTAGSDDGQPDCVGSPLRCCLRDGVPGDRVALVSYAPLRRWAAATGADPGAYDETGPVFIHADACTEPAPPGHPFARPGAQRLLRRYDARGQILGGTRLELPQDAAGALDTALDAAFADPEVALVHVRAVEYGCFQYEVRRP
ncbi:hypothetical protein GCM10010329_52730 [Streptomyces spiroverticillatus]|uniref:DUF1203 domain-containing protein n=1 Tax=Streptomyces finlayi TaxID=67296 RepID=A0A918X256_9ACTN|nr:DUF1203 domain-containing protein [Streptomyces finlayi]GHA22802.1 hypothetical protein GCM10010329_52730 [Streptomyces spiroverticillatus]GHD04614.1 hypothetical protein GCM10010334_53670 [Streptomyces finlayi]